ncbi:MAG: hypothetical protein AAGF13_00315 [Pseudomonadota bacterium]
MSRLMLFFAALAMAMASPLYARPFQEASSVEVTEDFEFGRIILRRGGGLRYALAPSRTETGALKICGAIQWRSSRRGLTHDLQRSLYFEVNGVRAFEGFGWMPVHNRALPFAGQKAECRIYPTVPVPASASYSVKVDFIRFANFAR